MHGVHIPTRALRQCPKINNEEASLQVEAKQLILYALQTQLALSLN